MNLIHTVRISLDRYINADNLLTTLLLIKLRLSPRTTTIRTATSNLRTMFGLHNLKGTIAKCTAHKRLSMVFFSFTWLPILNHQPKWWNGKNSGKNPEKFGRCLDWRSIAMKMFMNFFVHRWLACRRYQWDLSTFSRSLTWIEVCVRVLHGMANLLSSSHLCNHVWIENVFYITSQAKAFTAISCFHDIIRTFGCSVESISSCVLFYVYTCR